MGVVNEQRHRLLGPTKQILEIAFAPLGIVRDRHILLGREIVKQGGHEHGHRDPGLVQGQRARHDHLVFPLECGPQAARQDSLAGADDRGQRDQAAARDGSLDVARGLRVVLGLEEAGIDRRTGQVIVLHHFGQHSEIPAAPRWKMFAHRRKDLGTGQRPGQERIDEGAILIRQLGERQPDFVGNGAAGGQGVGKGQFTKRVRVTEGLHGDRGRGADLDHTVTAGDRRARQHQFVGERRNLVGAHLPPRLPVFAIAVQRDGASNWLKRPEALLAMLDPKLLIEQPHHTTTVSPASSESTS